MATAGNAAAQGAEHLNIKVWGADEEADYEEGKERVSEIKKDSGPEKSREAVPGTTRRPVDAGPTEGIAAARDEELVPQIKRVATTPRHGPTRGHSTQAEHHG